MTDRNGKVLLIYTGGTIGMGTNPKTHAMEPLDYNQLLKHVPEIKQIKAQISVLQFGKPLDSSDISPDIWKQLVSIITREYDNYDGFVIIHGTDTMAYTASALSFMMENLTKPVILTGSQLPVHELRSDGKENLITSLELAAMVNGQGVTPIPEVCIYFGGRLLRGNRATKQNADQFNAFESFNYPHLCEAGIAFKFANHHILQPDFSKPMVPHLDMDQNIIVVSLFPGMQKEVFDSLALSPHLRGIILRSYGSGNAPQLPWLTDTLHKITEQGITIVNISQCVAGTVCMENYDSGYHLLRAGVISGYDSTIEAAATKLMHLLARYKSQADVAKHMNSNLAGEITL